MKFKLDENLPGEGVLVLRAAGHDAVTVLDQGLGGRPDPEIFAVVQAEGRALITLDVGFGNIRTYTPRMSAGIIVLRLGRQSKPVVLAAIAEVAAAAVAEPVTGKLWIVEDGRLRIRG
jgi:predicted nuclease of predicted toxin-antitoxin system